MNSEEESPISDNAKIRNLKQPSGFTKIMSSICSEVTGSIAKIERDLITTKNKKRKACEKRRNLKKKLNIIANEIYTNEDYIETISKRIIQLEKMLNCSEAKQKGREQGMKDLQSKSSMPTKNAAEMVMYRARAKVLPNNTMETKPLVEGDLFIVDTDCGSDDAMAIVLALTQCPSKVLAFTCCFGNTTVDNVCKNVSKVKVICNQKQIPVYKGSSCPLIDRNRADIVHGSDGLGDCGEEFSTEGLQEEEEPAAFALLKLAKKYPGRITLVALAPLTNLAVAQRLDPKFTQSLKSIVCMGGNYKGIGNTTETAEFNFYSDPEAAHIIVSEAICPVVLVPWETTMDHGIMWGEFERLMNKPTKTAQFIKRATGVMADYCRRTHTTTLQDCDFLAMVAALFPRRSIRACIERAMAVECKGEFSTGLCICSLPESVKSDRKIIQIVEKFDKTFLEKLRDIMYD